MKEHAGILTHWSAADGAAKLHLPVHSKWLGIDCTFTWGLAIAAGLFAQYAWISHFLGEKLALLHLIPGGMTMVLMATISAVAWKRRTIQWSIYFGYNLLVLRPAVTLDENLVWLQWLTFAAMCGVVVSWCWRYLQKDGAGKWLIVAGVLVAINTLTHLAAESPFTHTYHLVVDRPSDFSGVDNNETWECAYDGTDWAVQCDARHFIASELIFVDADYDAGFSVVLSRFYSGYLNSLLGTDSMRWLSSVCINVLLWFLSCVAVYRLAQLFGQPGRVAVAAMLGTASAWGFVSLVSQPMPYLPAYAFGIFSIWAIVEQLVRPSLDIRLRTLLLLLPVLSIAVYESYPISLLCVLLLAIHRRYVSALVLIVAQLLVVVTWKKFGLEEVLGTTGDLASASSGVSNLTKDIHKWIEILVTINIKEFFLYLAVGVLAFLFGNLIVGACIGIWITARDRRQIFGSNPQRLFWLVIALANLLMLAAMIFIVPQTFHWSPMGMQPRLSFFSFAINLIAICYWVNGRWPAWLWAVPVTSLMIANLDKTGFAGIAMLFDYGAIGSYWY